jgi:hypothetical protein
MNRFIKFGAILTTIAMAVGFVFLPQLASSGSARDCDGNAVIYCGTYSTSELNHKITTGTGKADQSGAQLTSLFAQYGYSPSMAGSLQNGRVTKDNKVYLGNTVVKTNAFSMGRHKTTHSVDVPGISYPLWLRHPSESFVSSSIDAYVLMNYDGSFRMAIIKSCGNIVPGEIRERPQEERYNLEVRKWNDINGDSQRQISEPYLSGWSFRVTGPGTDTVITTGQTGSATLGNLVAGTYNIDEVSQPGWRAITDAHRSVALTSSQVIYFGNQMYSPERVAIQVIKFNDRNANRVMDGSETVLSGWTFQVTGNGISESMTTDSNGMASLTGLSAGRYVVTEVLRPGWENTTGISVVRDVNTDPTTQTFMYGNRQTTTPPTGGGDLPVSGPADAALPFVASLGMSGGILAWIRSKKQLLDSLRK